MYPTTYLCALSIREDFENSLTYSSLDIKIYMILFGFVDIDSRGIGAIWTLIHT